MRSFDKARHRAMLHAICKKETATLLRQLDRRFDSEDE
jgi:hypothetical protein